MDRLVFMRKMLFGLLLMLPGWVEAQLFTGKLVLLAGVQYNDFYTTAEHETTAMLQDQTAFRSLIEINYVFWRQENSEVFGGIRLNQGILERYGIRKYYGGFGFSDDRPYSVFHTYGAQIGFRYWLPEDTKSKYCLEAGLLLMHNRLSGFVPKWINYDYEIVPIRPGFRIGTLWNFDWLALSYSVVWQPFPAFYRTFDAAIDGNPINPGQRDGVRLGYKSLQFGVMVGLRL